MQSHSLARCFALLIALLLLPLAHAQNPESEQIDWPNPVWDLVTFGPSLGMTHITHAGDGSGRLFVVAKNGIIQVLQNDQLSTNRFLNIVTKVLNGTERGLFSVAFAPNFKTSGEFYVNYTRRPDGATVVSRFKVGTDTNVVDAASEQILLIVRQPAANHNGGQIAFGPDGYLYIGMGDGGGQGDPMLTAQDPRNLLGKMLRIDVSGSKTNYTIPPTNPFVGRDDVLPEIWASGLRNPWRFSFDRLTGDLIIADVGEAKMEEINFQPASSRGGENYGWSFYEGTLPFKFPPGREVPDDLVFPISTYTHSVGRSITGGEVMRGALTNRMYGVYLFSDFVTGHFGALKRIGTGWARADFGIILNPGQQRFQVSSFGQDEDGNIYALEMINNQGGGIFRLRDLNRVHAPTFSLTNGTYSTEQNVQLSSLSPGARIHYTLDGSDPTESSPSIASGGLLTIAETTTLRACAYRADLSPSPIATLRITLRATLEIQPNLGPITNGTQLTITASDPGALIRYTLDGTAPTNESPIYTNVLTLQGNQTLTVVASKPGWISATNNIFFGLLLPEWVSIQTVAGTGHEGLTDGPARSATFRRPYSIAITPDGTIYIGQTAGTILFEPQSIRQISTNGLVTTPWTNFYNPAGIAANSTGNVFIADGSSIFRAAADGTLQVYITDNGIRDSVGLTLDPSNNVFFAQRSDIGGFSPAGRFLWYRLEYPVLGLARNAHGQLFAGTSGGVVTFSTNGSPEIFAATEFGHADGPRENARFNPPASFYRVSFQTRALAFENNGSLLVADGSFLRKIDKNGTVSTLLDRMPGSPGWKLGVIGGIAIHPNGDIYLAADHAIKRISPDSDRDGIPDIDELSPFTVGTDDRSIDTDSDGSNNSLEYLAGTDPVKPASFPGLRAMVVDGGISLDWSGASPRGDLILEQSMDLTNWLPSTNSFYSGSTVVPGQSALTFFRARLE